MYIYVLCVYIYNVYTHTCVYIRIHTCIYTYIKYLKDPDASQQCPVESDPVCLSRLTRPLFPPALNLSTLASLSSATHLMFPAACSSFRLGGLSSTFSSIISCSSYRPQFKSHLPGSLQTTTPLPGAPKTGQIPLYSIFRD